MRVSARICQKLDTVVRQQSAVTWPTAVQYRDQTDLDSTRISVSVAISDSVIRSHGLDVFISCIIDNARNNARCKKARKATHGLDGHIKRGQDSLWKSQSE